MLDVSFVSSDYRLAASVSSCARKMEQFGRCALLAQGPSILRLAATEEAGNKTAPQLQFKDSGTEEFLNLIRAPHNAPCFHYADTCSNLRCKLWDCETVVGAQMKWLQCKHSNFRPLEFSYLYCAFLSGSSDTVGCCLLSEADWCLTLRLFQAINKLDSLTGVVMSQLTFSRWKKRNPISGPAEPGAVATAENLLHSAQSESTMIHKEAENNYFWLQQRKHLADVPQLGLYWQLHLFSVHHRSSVDPFILWGWQSSSVPSSSKNTHTHTHTDFDITKHSGCHPSS